MTPEEKLAYNRDVNRRWRARHREKERARHAANRAKNPGGAAVLCKSWRDRNPDKVRRWALDNPEKVKMARRVSQHNRRNAPGKLCSADARFLIEQPCAYCGAPSAQVEHCTPLARGGHNDLSNCVGACAPCNMRKNTKTVLEFTGLWPMGL